MCGFRIERKEERASDGVNHVSGVGAASTTRLKTARTWCSALAFPAPVAQELDWLEIGLVGHLRAIGDPVAQVKVWQAELSTLLDLPQHVVGAVTRAKHVGVEE